MQLRSLSVLLILLLGLCAAPAMGEKESLTKSRALGEAELKLSTDLLQLTNATLLPEGMTRQELVARLQAAQQFRTVGQLVRGTGTRAPSEVVYVYVTLERGVPLSAVDPFAWRVRNRDEASGTVAAWVEVSRLLSLASVPGVTQIRPVLRPVTHTGSVTSEGDRIHLADQVRARYGLTGAGVKIGIISDGVDHRSSAVATGDLPPDVHVLRNSQGGDEGTAMLEIVHDIAPGAELYFHDMGENTIDFAGGVDALANAGCTIICDDIGWLADPFFEDGALAAHIQALTSSRNLLYFSSAGNDARRHYQGTYLSDGRDEGNFHDFSGGNAPVNKYLYVRIPPGGSLFSVLEWDDPWTTSSNDYDLYLYNTDGYGQPIGWSEYVQDGNDAPLEYFSYDNLGSATIEGEIDISNYNGAAGARTLELFMYPGGGTQIYTDNIVAADSIYGHPAAANVISVAAIDAADPGADTVEPFSSRGPATIRYPGAVQRAKPEIAGIDGVSITGAGGFGSGGRFFGTSASAPDVAAVTALLWSGTPTRTAAEVRAALLSSAVDLGAAGSDTTFGRGRADAMRLATALGLGTPTPTPTPTLPTIKVVPGGIGVPTSTQSNGLYDDVNGNGRKDFADVVLLFNQLEWVAANEPTAAFDYNANGRIDFADVVGLFNGL